MKLLLFTILLNGIIASKISSNIMSFEVPPGTIKISENIYFDKTEVTNLDWREYMYWTKGIYGNNSNEFIKTIPDTSIWFQDKTWNDDLSYYLNPKYNDYPVVGISYEQALNYCKWRSDRVNELIWLKQKEISFESVVNFDYKYDDLPKVFNYRLPTREEWLKASKTEFEKVSGSDHITQNMPNPVGDRKINAIFGLGNNVSEMISEKGIAMGGNWKTTNGFIQIEYSNVMNTLGFRCVCTKIE